MNKQDHLPDGRDEPAVKPREVELCEKIAAAEARLQIATAIKAVGGGSVNRTR